ncbi:hypothetical protein TYRP_011527, partial [Tyrophagus putrescentiae]
MLAPVKASMKRSSATSDGLPMAFLTVDREKEVMRVLFKGRHLRLLLGEDVLREDAKGVQRADANEGVVGLAEDGGHKLVAGHQLPVDPDLRDDHPVLGDDARLVGGNHRDGAQRLQGVDVLNVAVPAGQFLGDLRLGDVQRGKERLGDDANVEADEEHDGAEEGKAVSEGPEGEGDRHQNGQRGDGVQKVALQVAPGQVVVSRPRHHAPSVALVDEGVPQEQISNKVPAAFQVVVALGVHVVGEDAQGEDEGQQGEANVVLQQVVVGEVDDEAEQGAEPELRIVDAEEVAEELVELGAPFPLHLRHVEALVSLKGGLHVLQRQLQVDYQRVENLRLVDHLS